MCLNGSKGRVRLRIIGESNHWQGKQHIVQQLRVLPAPLPVVLTDTATATSAIGSSAKAASRRSSLSRFGLWCPEYSFPVSHQTHSRAVLIAIAMTTTFWITKCLSAGQRLCQSVKESVRSISLREPHSCITRFVLLGQRCATGLLRKNMIDVADVDAI